MIDLHTHSTYSDGSLTPPELVQLAKDVGLTAIALTDHDCTDGLSSFCAACSGTGVECVPGVEISAEVPKGTLHMLGYYIDRENERLQSVLKEIRNGREIRNGKILKKLNELGMDLSWEEVSSYAGEDVIGRPHFSQAMVERGFVGSKKEAFDRYLARGKSAYVDRFRLSPAESVDVIAGAGGVAVLAHPFTLDISGHELDAYVGSLVKIGLQGIEVYYSEHSRAYVKQCEKLAERYDLVKTGGSDFHGDANPGIKLGLGFGGLAVHDDLLVLLRRRAEAVRVAA
ncbi:MAG: PHP domain-containing protein [Verrucomicrobiota bacterium]